MATLVLINATQRSSYIDIPFSDGRSALDVLASRVSALEGNPSIVVLTGSGDPGNYPPNWVRHEAGIMNETTLVETLTALCDGPEDAAGPDGIRDVLYWHIDEPFLDPVLTSRMFENHHRYAAEYSFADGYPSGLAPQLLSRGILGRLLPLTRAEPVKRDVLFTIIQRDINAFDIETSLAEHDMRMLRLELACDSRRNWLLCKRLHDGGCTDAPAVVKKIREDQTVLRTLPAHIMVDVVEGTPQDVAYSPYKLFGPAGKGKTREMEPERFAQIVTEVEEFSPGSVFSIGVWGEPGLHARIESLIETAAAVALVVETSGVGWNDAVVDGILSKNYPKLTWIVHLDAVDPSLYRAVRGDGFEEANRFVERVMARSPDRCYVQTTRYTDLEEHTESFYRHWKERTENIIVQKYDHFCGVLPDKRVTDISPVRRFPCWHVKRDLLVLVDGTVPLCREDIYSKHKVGNVFTDGIGKLWDAIEPIHAAHVTGDYPALCQSCDEYYTFNF